MKKTISLLLCVLLVCTGCTDVPEEETTHVSVMESLEEAQYVRYVYCGTGSVNTVYLYQSDLRSFHIYCADEVISVGYRNKELSDEIVYVYGGACQNEALYSDYQNTLRELNISESDLLDFLKEMHEQSVSPDTFLQFSEQFAQWDTEEKTTVLTFEDAAFVATYTECLESLRFIKGDTELEIYPVFDSSEESIYFDWLFLYGLTNQSVLHMFDSNPYDN